MVAASAVAAIAALPVTAGAAVNPPTIASQFTPGSIATGATTALSFTITNPNASGSLSGIAFTDTLPSGVVVDTPNGQTGTCGSNGVLTAVAGSSTISLTGGKVAAGANCVVQVSVTSTTPGSHQNSTGPVTSTEGGSGNSDVQTLSVFALPTVVVSAPKEGAAYDFGQRVIARYSCQDAFGAPGISACSGDADAGTAIDTSTVGANTFSVSAISADGGITTQTIDYTVRPDNRFTLAHVKSRAHGVVTFTANLPGAGKLVVLESAPKAGKASAGVVQLKPGKGRITFAQTSVKVTDAGDVQVTVKPGAAGKRLLANAKRQIRAKLLVEFVPTGGVGRVLTVAGIPIKP